MIHHFILDDKNKAAETLIEVLKAMSKNNKAITSVDDIGEVNVIKLRNKALIFI